MSNIRVHHFAPLTDRLVAEHLAATLAAGSTILTVEVPGQRQPDELLLEHDGAGYFVRLGHLRFRLVSCRLTVHGGQASSFVYRVEMMRAL